MIKEYLNIINYLDKSVERYVKDYDKDYAWTIVPIYTEEYCALEVMFLDDILSRSEINYFKKILNDEFDNIITDYECLTDVGIPRKTTLIINLLSPGGVRLTKIKNICSNIC